MKSQGRRSRGRESRASQDGGLLESARVADPQQSSFSPNRDSSVQSKAQTQQAAAAAASPVALSDMGASVAQAQRPAHADFVHYFAEWDGGDAERLEGEASASVLRLLHGVELRSSSRSRGGPLRADMFEVKLIPSNHPLAAGALSDTLHIIARHGDVPSPLLLRMPHRASAEQLGQLAFYRSETPDSEMQLVEGGCFWSDGYAEVEVNSFSVWKVAPLMLVATGAAAWAVSKRLRPSIPRRRLSSGLSYTRRMRNLPPTTTLPASARSAITKRLPFVVARQSRSL